MNNQKKITPKKTRKKTRKDKLIKTAQRFFETRENIKFEGQSPIPVKLGLAEKQNYRFDLHAPHKDFEKIIIICQPHKWRKDKTLPKRKITLWHEAMFYFHLTPKNYRKIFFCLKSTQNQQTLAEYYLLHYGHLIPSEVEFWEYCEETKSAIRLIRNSALMPKRKAAKVWMLRPLYAALCIIGLALPYTQFLPWLLTHGLAARLFFSDMFANGVASAFALDVFISYAVLCLFVLVEGARLRMKHLWMPITGALIFGVSFALPLFLYMRESQQAASNQK